MKKMFSLRGWVVPGLFVYTALAASLSGCASGSKSGDGVKSDPYLWLEEVEGDKALSWVREQNAKSQGQIESSALFKENSDDIRKIILAKDRIPDIVNRGNFVYNYWQDEKSVRGLWRRTTLADFKTAQPTWDVIIDLDELSKKENENWVWHGADCLPLAYDRCLISLSRGGKDAVDIREYDISKREFVKGGFHLPEAKTNASWMDQDRLFVATDFGPGTLSKSGYALQLKILHRGQALDKATLVLKGGDDDMTVSGSTTFRAEGTWQFVYLVKDFYTSEAYLLSEKHKLVKIPIPNDAKTVEVFNRKLFVSLRTPWLGEGWSFKADDLISLSLEDLKKPPQLVFSPPVGVSVQAVLATESALFIDLLDHVKGRVVRLHEGESGWTTTDVAFPSKGTLSIYSGDSFSDVMLANYQGFLETPTLMAAHVHIHDVRIEKIKSLPARFDASPFDVDQFSAVSKDGTKIPYFVVRPRDLKNDGMAPTLLYGYGGFELPMTPTYLGSVGKVWLEKNHGVYVLANIRGGGEFGPTWHLQAIKENRQKVFDDFIAVAEDLIARKITSPAHLGIMGGSNGGLLMGGTFTQRPELFKAVVCQVPLLDMLRYHKLLAGYSWMAEYGNPDIPAERAYIEKYSPYQNLRQGVKYPDLLFMTSTKDDRVHPGHARKMAARMEAMGQPVLFYENIEGGHGAAANLEQRIHFTALEWTFLSNELKGEARR